MRGKTITIGVLASGSGTNLQAIIDAAAAKRLNATVAIVVSDTPGARALERADQAGIPARLFERATFDSRRAFEEAIVAALHERGVELVCLAGYMRIVGRTMLEAFPNRIINIHPALLPAFPGLTAQRQAFDYGVKIAGCTAHFVDGQVDHGPIISQRAVPVEEDDTPESLQQRILAAEHQLYPEAIQLIAEGRIAIEGRRVHIH